MSAVTSEGYELNLQKTIAGSPEDVFDAWLDIDILGRWFGPSDEMSVEIKLLEPREGGKYHVAMTSPDGETFDLHGEYVRIDRPNELVMTFYWVSEPDQVMLSTVNFSPSDAGTEINLRHEKLPNEASRDAHAQGWQGTLARLQRLFESQSSE